MSPQQPSTANRASREVGARDRPPTSMLKVLTDMAICRPCKDNHRSREFMGKQPSLEDGISHNFFPFFDFYIFSSSSLCISDPWGLEGDRYMVELSCLLEHSAL